MARLTCLTYQQGDGLLHKLDARIKLLALIVVSLGSLAAGPMSMGLLTVLTLAALRQTRFPLGWFFVETRRFAFFLLIILLTRALTTPGEPLLSAGPLAMSREGLHAGGMLCWRLMLIVLLGLVLSMTTRSEQIRAAILWCLRPLPGVASKRIGTMIGLLMRFIPVIFHQSREISDAQQARCIAHRKNPIYRLSKFSLPLLRRTMVTADRLAIAMEARGYSDTRTAPVLRTDRKDRIALVVILCVSIILVFR